MWNNTNKKTVLISLISVSLLVAMSISACSGSVKETKTVTIPSQKIEYSAGNVSFDLTVPEYTGDVFTYYKGTVKVPKEEEHHLDIGDGWREFYFQVSSDPDEEHVFVEPYETTGDYIADVLSSWKTVSIDDTDPEFFKLLSSKTGNREYYPLVETFDLPRTYRERDYGVFEKNDDLDMIHQYYVRSKIDTLPVHSGIMSPCVGVKYNGVEHIPVHGRNNAISLLKNDVVFEVDSHVYSADTEIDRVALSEVADINQHLDEVVAFMRKELYGISGRYVFYNAEIVYLPLVFKFEEVDYQPPATHDIYLIPVWSLDFAFLSDNERLDTSFIAGSIDLDIKSGEVISCKLP